MIFPVVNINLKWYLIPKLLLVFRIFRPKVTKILRICRKKYCEFPPWDLNMRLLVKRSKIDPNFNIIVFISTKKASRPVQRARADSYSTVPFALSDTNRFSLTVLLRFRFGQRC